MAYIDYYKVLELDKNASTADIKKAYRKLARKYHPDVNPNDTEAQRKFQEINEANEVLSNPENRKKYDAYGKDWQHADDIEKARKQQQYQRQGTGGGFDGFGQEGFSDFFESMFGGGGGRSTRGAYGQQVQYKGQDVSARLQLSLRDVYKTHKRTLTVNGKNIRLTIPAGVEDGQTIKISGHGGPGINGGPKGDLFIEFSIVNDTAFKRDRSNLYKTIPLDLYKAVLGGTLTVDTFDGKAKLTVKPGTQNGTKVKLKGKGFPVYKKEGTFGDLFITYEIRIPENLSSEEKNLFKQLEALR